MPAGTSGTQRSCAEQQSVLRQAAKQCPWLQLPAPWVASRRRTAVVQLAASSSHRVDAARRSWQKPAPLGWTWAASRGGWDSSHRVAKRLCWLLQEAKGQNATLNDYVDKYHHDHFLRRCAAVATENEPQPRGTAELGKAVV